MVLCERKGKTRRFTLRGVKDENRQRTERYEL